MLAFIAVVTILCVGCKQVTIGDCIVQYGMSRYEYSGSDPKEVDEFAKYIEEILQQEISKVSGLTSMRDNQWKYPSCTDQTYPSLKAEVAKACKNAEARMTAEPPAGNYALVYEVSMQFEKTEIIWKSKKFGDRE